MKSACQNVWNVCLSYFNFTLFEPVMPDVLHKSHSIFPWMCGCVYKLSLREIIHRVSCCSRKAINNGVVWWSRVTVMIPKVIYFSIAPPTTTWVFYSSDTVAGCWWLQCFFLFFFYLLINKQVSSWSLGHSPSSLTFLSQLAMLVRNHNEACFLASLSQLSLAF